jgi:2-methylaconitate cis-trans-isomerase PrpF
MQTEAIRCVFMRGGTSRALVFRREDLPVRREAQEALFLAAMGSPDPNGRQLDGMGGGISSLSKVCIVGAPTRPDADIDYTFAQIGVDRATVDWNSNCGNMSSAMGPFAADEGLVDVPRDGGATVRIHNTNTGKIIVANFRTKGGRAAVAGDLAIDGVAGTGSPVRLEFRDVAGSRTGRMLPSGRAQDLLKRRDGGDVRASLVDAANPCVFVAAEDLGLTGAESPEIIEGTTGLMDEFEHLRRQAAVLMGLATDTETAGASRAVPFIGIVAKVTPWRDRSARELGPADADIAVRMLSSGQPHKAVPVTSALCVAAAVRTPGTVPHACATAGAGAIRIGHASGTIMVDAPVDMQGRVQHASVFRTARRLFQGEVLVPICKG